MGHIPKNHSKASWQIEQKSIAPESARLNPPLYAPQNYSNAVDYIERRMAEVIDRHIKPDYFKGRKPGTRIVSELFIDPVTGERTERFFAQ